ncbi:hypothetical protein BPY_00830 [Bifidobacterium psychraerophilum]
MMVHAIAVWRIGKGGVADALWQYVMIARRRIPGLMPRVTVAAGSHEGKWLRGSEQRSKGATCYEECQ